jgi:glycosyltransferase involved in cell wall biosynthesis
LKINFILPTVDMSGGNRVIAIHAELLQKKGHDITIISVPHQKQTWHERARELIKGNGWNITRQIAPSHFDGLSLRHIIIESARPICTNDVPDGDVVVATWWETAEWVKKLPPEKGRKFYFIQHHEVFEYTPNDRVEATWDFSMQKIVVAEWLREIANKRNNSKRIDLVPNAVDHLQFYAPERKKQKTPTIGMLYAPMHWKGTDIAIKAINIARVTLPELKVIALGSHDEKSDFILPEDTVYVKSPAQDKIREVYAQCDAWLFASRSEGFGLPILEAMACRTPVIGVPTGAAPELLRDNTGFLVESENPEAMAKAILEVLSLEETQWQQLSMRAFERVQSYTWSDASLLFEEALLHGTDH